MVFLFCSRCRQVAKRGGCHRGLQHGGSANPLGLVPEHLWWWRYCYRAALVTAWLTKQRRVPPNESEHLRGKTSATVYGWLILVVFGSYNYLFHFFFLCNSNFHPKNTFFVPVLIQVRQRDRSRSPVSLRDDLLFCLTCAHSLLSAQMGLITTEWELNSRHCRNKNSILTNTKKNQKQVAVCWPGRILLLSAKDREQGCRSKDSVQKKSSQFSGHFYFVVSSNEKACFNHTTHTHITLRAALSGRPVLSAAVVALHSTTGFTTTSQNRVRWW